MDKFLNQKKSFFDKTLQFLLETSFKSSAQDLSPMGHGNFFCAHGSWVQKVPMGTSKMLMGTSKLKKSAQTRAHGSFLNGSWVFGHGNARGGIRTSELPDNRTFGVNVLVDVFVDVFVDVLILKYFFR